MQAQPFQKPCEGVTQLREERYGKIMDLTNTLWLFPILFMVHNFEEIVMIPRWWRHTPDKTIKSPFVKLAHYPQETTALMIGSIFALFSVVPAWSIFTRHLLVGIGLALAFGFQLLGHIAEFIRFRRYMPHIVTSVLTVPYYPILYVVARHNGYSIGTLALATTGMGVFGLVVLFSSHACVPAISRWLKS
jgi:hypothetical protein